MTFPLARHLRGRLLQGDYSPLDFEVKPYGLEPGAVYVLAWTRGPSEWVPGYGVRSPRVPVWFITITDVVRHRKGFWRARFDVTDNRDPDLFLRRGGGYASFDELQAGRVPDPDWLDAHSEMVASFWVRRRLERQVAEQRERGRERSRARRKRAA